MRLIRRALLLLCLVTGLFVLDQPTLASPDLQACLTSCNTAHQSCAGSAEIAYWDCINATAYTWASCMDPVNAQRSYCDANANQTYWDTMNYQCLPLSAGPGGYDAYNICAGMAESTLQGDLWMCGYDWMNGSYWCNVTDGHANCEESYGNALESCHETENNCDDTCYASYGGG